MFNTTRSDSTASLLAFAGALAILAAQVGSRATRDALFLSTFPVDVLPRMMLASAAVSLTSALGMARLLTRFGPDRVVPAAFGVSASLFIAEWFLTQAAPSIAPIVLYLHVGALGAVLISGFWSVLNERFDPYTGKTVLGQAGAFAALGGVLGGLAAERIGALYGISAMLMFLSSLHALCAMGVLAIGRPESPSQRSQAEAPEEGSGFDIIRRTPLLKLMAGLAMIIAMTEAFLDFVLKSAAVERFPDEAELIRFFAIFEMSVGGIAFVLQASLGTRVLRRFGLGWAMTVRPATVLIATGVGALFANFWTLILPRATDIVSTRSTYNSGFESLYTSLKSGVKRPTKAYIDVGANRVGDMAGALLILALVPFIPTALVLVLAVVTAGAALLLVLRVQRAYVTQLAENLKSGAVTLDDSEGLDAVTHRTLYDTRTAGIDRGDVLAQIQAVRAAQASEKAQKAVPTEAEVGQASAERQALFRQIEAIESGEAARVREALHESGQDARLVPHVIPLLGGRRRADEALVFLRSMAPRIVGQLTDALADRDVEVAVRRQIPRALEMARNRRAVDGLCIGLEDEDFEVRVSCARAAARIIAREPEIKVAAARIYALAERELARNPDAWEEAAGSRDARDEPALLERLEAARVGRRVEHLFTLLALALGPDLMAATLRSLYSEDAHLRGTALEYLQTTLPESLRSGLWPRIPGARPVVPKRPTEEVADELMKTSVKLRIAGK